MTSAASRSFLFAHLHADGGGWQALHDRVQAALAGWPEATVVGSFMGLFGISNQEIFLVLALPVGGDGLVALRARLPADIAIRDGLPMRATVRPADDTPLTRPGLYVFRFFDVAAADVDEVARLSQVAWETWEQDSDYSAEPHGLFRFSDPNAERGRMLLLTWYEDLRSWERSRTPHPDAVANFRRRAALSRSALPYATRLIGGPA